VAEREHLVTRIEIDDPVEETIGLAAGLAGCAIRVREVRRLDAEMLREFGVPGSI
jgi:hypothetical protein